MHRLGTRAIPLLTQALREDGDPAVRQFAAEALGGIQAGDEASLPRT